MGYEVTKFNYPSYEDEDLYQMHKTVDDKWSQKYVEWFETGCHKDSDCKWNNRLTELIKKLRKNHTLKEIHEMCDGEVAYSTLSVQQYYGNMMESTARTTYYLLRKAKL